MTESLGVSFSYSDSTAESAQNAGLNLTFKPSLNTATPQGGYRIVQGAGTDGNGDRFFAPALSNTPARYQWGANFEVVGKTDPQKLSYAGAWKNTKGTVADLAAHIAKGHPWMPALLDGNQKRWQSNANSASLLALDIDDGLTIPEALQHPFIAAHCGLGIESNSSTPEHHKFRLVFPLAEPIAGWQNIKTATLYLQHMVGSADKACKDASRFYYGAAGRQPFTLSGNTLPQDFLQQAIDWHSGLEAQAQAERQRKAAERAATRERVLADGGQDLGALIEEAEQRLGFDAFLPYTDSDSEKGGKIRCKPVFRTGSGSKSAFLTEHNGIYLYCDPASGEKAMSGFRFWARIEGRETTGAGFIESARDFCRLAGIEVPEREWKPGLTAIAGGGKGGKGKTPSGARDFREMQSREIVHRILNPFEGREIVEVHTQAEAVDFLLKNPYTLITGATGKGKTELIAEFIRTSIRLGLHTIADFFPFTPVRSLSHAVAASFGTPYRGCVHSILTIAPEVLKRDNACGVYDEQEQDLYALNVSSLCREQRGLKIEKHEAAIRHFKRILLSSATNNLKDLEYCEEVSGQTFKILHYNPLGHSKGKIVIHTGDPSIKGSARTARAAVEAMISPKSYVACDTVKAAVTAHILAQERIQSGGDVPILAHSKAAEDPRLSAMVKSSNPGAIHCEIGNPGLITTQVLQSGFSLKPQQPGAQLFENCLGIFTGHTSPPSIALQQMGRDRGSQERHVYVPRTATPPQRLARGFAPKGQGKRSDRVKAQWAADVAALEDEMHYGNFKGFEFLSGPAKDWYQKLEQQQQLEYSHYAAAFGAYAQLDGYEVVWAKPTKAEVLDRSGEVKQQLAQPIAAAYKLDFDGYRRLMEKQELTVEEEHEIEAYLIRDYYGIPFDGDLTVEQIIAEGFGKGRKALKAALRVVWEGQAEADDQKRRDSIGDRGYVWDVTCHELSKWRFEELGVEAVLAHSITQGRSHFDPVIRAFADRLAARQGELGEGSKVLGHRLPWRGADVEAHYKAVNAWIGMILWREYGIKSHSQKLRIEGQRVNHYTVDPDSLAALQAAVAQKGETQIQKGFGARSTPLSKIFYQGVDQGRRVVKIGEKRWFVDTINGQECACLVGADPKDPGEWLPIEWVATATAA